MEQKAGVEKILKIKKNKGDENARNMAVRPHRVPDINPEAESLVNLIDLSDADVPPLLTCDVNADQTRFDGSSRLALSWTVDREMRKAGD